MNLCDRNPVNLGSKRLREQTDFDRGFDTDNTPVPRGVSKRQRRTVSQHHDLTQVVEIFQKNKRRGQDLVYQGNQVVDEKITAELPVAQIETQQESDLLLSQFKTTDQLLWEATYDMAKLQFKESPSEEHKPDFEEALDNFLDFQEPEREASG